MIFSIIAIAGGLGFLVMEDDSGLQRGIFGSFIAIHAFRLGVVVPDTWEPVAFVGQWVANILVAVFAVGAYLGRRQRSAAL